jgi:acyl-coenzyme A synthetase/AMP-(fatty) acid ligase
MGGRDTGAEEGALPRGERIVAIAQRALRDYSARRAIQFDDVWYAYADLRRVADQIAVLLRESGAEQIAPVAFAPRNRPSAVAALLALIGNARNIRMAYAYQSGAALAKALERMKPSILVAAAEDFSPEVVQQLRKDGVAGVALREMEAAFAPGLERVTRETDPNAAKTPTFEILTSGTTGPAKLFPWTYAQLDERVLGGNVIYGGGRDVSDDPPPLVNSPMGNISGVYTVLPSMLIGEKFVLHDRYTLDAWRDYVRRYKPKELHLTPVGIRMALDANIPPEELASAKLTRTGNSVLDESVWRAFEGRYNMPILMSYGATEFGGVVCSMTADMVAQFGQSKIGSVGRPFGAAQVRIVDGQSGDVLPAGQAGLLEVLMPLFSNDWTRTSDMAKIDEDGFVYILGRADGAIVRGGFKLLPETIEGALREHPAVGAAAVIGLDDQRLGQVPVAVIETKPGNERPTPAQLETHLRAHVPATHIPVDWRFVDELPKTGSLKVSRAEVKALFADRSAG